MNFISRNLVLLLGILVMPSNLMARDGLAIMGDSISTGAASHPALTYDSLVLWNVMTGKLSVEAKRSDIPEHPDVKWGLDLSPPRRLWPSSRENDGGSGWIWLHSIQALSRAALDTEEYSYGYIAGRALGFDPSDIWFAGDNGTRAEHGVIHAARIIEQGGGELPSHILMLYTGNDLCASTWELMVDAQTYGRGLKDAILYLARNGRAAPGTTVKVFLPAFLPVTTLISEKSILDKRIQFYGTELTCAEARKRMFAAPEQTQGREQVSDYRYPFFAQMMPPNPALLCPTLFSRAADEPDKLSLLANRIRAYREAQREVVESMTKLFAENPSLTPLEIKYIDTTETIAFDAADISSDCFHLSATGHVKVAATLLRGIRP